MLSVSCLLVACGDNSPAPPADAITRRDASVDADASGLDARTSDASTADAAPVDAPLVDAAPPDAFVCTDPCLASDCVTALPVGTSCGANGLYCDAMAACVAPNCSDGLLNGSETDVDCGGSCAPTATCTNGQSCTVGADCASSLCLTGVCAAPSCGDGNLFLGELCDDGNVVADDACAANCLPTGCGDGVISGAETCDDGNLDNGDGCDDNCSLSACGNGILSGFETCDDGNVLDGDGCDSACLIECADTDTAMLVRTDEPVALVDLGTAASEVEPAADGTIVRLEVLIDRITHPHAGELTLTLTSPTGVTRELIRNRGGNNADVVHTQFLDGATPLAGGTPPFWGRFAPAQTLVVGGDFLGVTAAGIWTLTVEDNVAGTTGVPDGWTLSGCVAPPDL